MKNYGYLIAIEGIDGCGKSTLAKNLYETLSERSKKPFDKLSANGDSNHKPSQPKTIKGVLLTQEPGDTTLGKKLRAILHEEKETTCDLAEYLLFAADRAQHFEEKIIPALKEKKLIISDRMADSSLAYQGYGRELSKENILFVNTWAMQNIKPNLTLYVKIDTETALQRIGSRGEILTSFEKEKKEFWQRVIHGFEKMYENRSDVITLDGTLSEEKLCAKALERIESFIKNEEDASPHSTDCRK